MEWSPQLGRTRLGGKMGGKKGKREKYSACVVVDRVRKSSINKTAPSFKDRRNGRKNERTKFQPASYNSAFAIPTVVHSIFLFDWNAWVTRKQEGPKAQWEKYGHEYQISRDLAEFAYCWSIFLSVKPTLSRKLSSLRIFVLLASFSFSSDIKRGKWIRFSAPSQFLWSFTHCCTARLTLSQFYSLKIRRSTFPNYIKFENLRILRLQKLKKGRSSM